MLISSNAQKVLKTLHLLAVSFWVGGCLAMIASSYVALEAQSGEELYGMLRSFRVINVIVVVYLGAFGSFFTGLAYSLCTNRGFFRHKWVVCKWVITLYLMVCGFVFLSPWSATFIDMARVQGLDALQDVVFQEYYGRHQLFQNIELGLFIIAIVVSVYKPWEQKEITAIQRRRAN